MYLSVHMLKGGLGISMKDVLREDMLEKDILSDISKKNTSKKDILKEDNLFVQAIFGWYFLASSQLNIAESRE